MVGEFFFFVNGLADDPLYFYLEMMQSFRRPVTEFCWVKDFLPAYCSLKAGRVSENPRAISQDSSNFLHDARVLNICLTSKS